MKLSEKKSFFSSLVLNLRLLYELILMILVVNYGFVVWFLGLFWWTKKQDVNGQLALVTGGANGFGREISFQFASLGCDIAIADIDRKSAMITVEDIKKQHPGVRIQWYQTDVSNPEQVDLLKTNILKDFGRSVEILINNAGVMEMFSFSIDQPSIFKKIVDVNLMAHVLTINAFLPPMIENQRGLIVAVASEAIFAGARYGAAYCSSKVAVKTLMDSLKDDLKMRGIKGINVCTALPYFMKTDVEMLNRFKFLIPPICPKYAARILANNVLRNVTTFTIPTTHYYCMAPIRFFPEKVRFILLNWLLPRILGLTKDCDEFLQNQKQNRKNQMNGNTNVTLDLNRY
ncbi:short-chain dehydrogenase/reductase family 16C member 6-like [Ctenocephalides felis]|uniref:short-chain dehydrogenase/reductase family 16C member 6-like n=1 Tax=Ctenocephalides felis TaxID=7515 RepID=UPI000E6E3215|nr:short-chain dehydrogenase/reductase family 16C member 6-like [Ctenocephalides felis]